MNIYIYIYIYIYLCVCVCKCRQKSPIFHLRKYNNWVKAVLIQRYCVRGACVLDLCCGKGGDLVKWIKARVHHVVAVDHAEGSVRDAIARYNNLTRPPFTAEFYLTDCFKVCLHERESECVCEREWVSVRVSG
jgi:mRNA (guanine-N7-)-methyltransferase